MEQITIKKLDDFDKANIISEVQDKLSFLLVAIGELLQTSDSYTDTVVVGLHNILNDCCKQLEKVK